MKTFVFMTIKHKMPSIASTIYEFSGMTRDHTSSKLRLVINWGLGTRGSVFSSSTFA